MSGQKLTVVISQSQGKNLVKRPLEEDLVSALIMEPEIDVSLVPHLYDLTTDHGGMLFLRSVSGDLVVLAWLYPRATRWILDRNGIKGRSGRTLLSGANDVETADESLESNGVGAQEAGARKIYCIDLSRQLEAEAYIKEIRRIAEERRVSTVDLSPLASQGIGPGVSPICERTESISPASGNGQHSSRPPDRLSESGSVRRRWYPIIDYDRCTNCMECIDFCLFGVYGIDAQDRVVIEVEDNCKKGCPACSRVCPENAIMFPGHKIAAIAGADGDVAGLKIDLSMLFEAAPALELAIQERDAELIKDGRKTIQTRTGNTEPHADVDAQEPDELDDLIDRLDRLPL